MPIYVPIIMYAVRLFIVVLQELQCLPNCLHIGIIKVMSFFTKFCSSTLLASEIANVLPKVVLQELHYFCV